MSQNCFSCRFFEFDPRANANEEGFCLRYPPVQATSGGLATLTRTVGDNWCGEYQYNGGQQRPAK